MRVRLYNTGPLKIEPRAPSGHPRFITGRGDSSTSTLADLVADHAADCRAANRAEHPAIGRDRSGGPADPGTDHGAFFARRHAVPGRATTDRNGQHESRKTSPDVHDDLLARRRPIAREREHPRAQKSDGRQERDVP